MTKGEYIDFIRNSLQMVDKTQKYHRNQVDAALNAAINTVFNEMYAENPKSMKKALERYSVTTTLTPTDVSLRGRYVAVLTDDVVDLPRKTGGILAIRQWSGGGIPSITTTVTNYVPVSISEGEQFYGSEASLSGVVVGYSWSKFKQLEFWGMGATEATNKIEVRYIKQFKDYAITEDVLLPYGKDERIIELTRQYLGDIPPKEIVNDNADIQVNG